MRIDLLCTMRALAYEAGEEADRQSDRGNHQRARYLSAYATGMQRSYENQLQIQIDFNRSACSRGGK